jgi:2-haloalkanoic acid dehalogenase type II
MPSTTKCNYHAVVFDLLTALVDSWTLWNDVAGSPADGMRWRQRYLEITYGCGAYRPYEVLVREAAVEAGLPAALAAALEMRWSELQPWPEAAGVLTELARHVPLAIATNCSDRLGRAIARRVGDVFKVVVTAESAGHYKPHPEPYRAVLRALGTDARSTLFVAGSAADVPGAQHVGMPVYWHNRIGLAPRGDARPEYLERTLEALPGIVLSSR